MPLISVFYISQSILDPIKAEDVVSEIIHSARTKNSENGITGALIFTGTHFAQIIEGPEIEIDRLMAHIRQDRRHTEILIIQHSAITKRRFANWSMAYSGPSQFVARHVTRVLKAKSADARADASEWLIQLLSEFSSSNW